MNKLNKTTMVLLLFIFVLHHYFGKPFLVLAETNKESQAELIEATTDEQKESSAEMREKNSDSSVRGTSEESSENLTTNDTSETIHSSELTLESASEPPKLNKSAPRSVLQDGDSYWLVSSASQLKSYLMEGKKLLRLTKDLQLESIGYKLFDGVVIDGNGFRITYNKAGSYVIGFYLEQSNATVTIKNALFGHTDGSGADGYYGIVTGNAGYSNATIIFENVIYVSSNGQPLYNPNGKFLFRGENTFIQVQYGLAAYAQEWAETNYIEIQSGSTMVYHETAANLGFIYSYSTASNNPYKNSSQVVVKKEATFDVTTNHTFLYSAANFSQNVTVEDGGTLKVSQTETANAVRKRFIYPDLIAGTPVKFDFEQNSNVNLNLKLPIQVKAAKGSMSIAQNANVKMTVEVGPMFDITARNQFNIAIYDPKKADFTGTKQGTFGLLTDSVTHDSLILLTSNSLKIESYLHSINKLAEFETKTTVLNANGAVYRNYIGNSVLPEHLNLLGASRRLVFTSVQLPKILATKAEQPTGNSVNLAVTSENYGSSIKEVKYLLFTSLEETNQLEKAKHIENVTDFEGENTTNLYTHEHQMNELNPNTNYWFQAMVTSQNGRSEFSSPVAFSTEPVLNTIYSGSITTNSAVLIGVLASDTGVWTDFSNGEAGAVKNKQADYGGMYGNLSFEYSKEEQFTNYQTSKPVLDGKKNQFFYTELTGLEDNTTYYVRVRGTSVSGAEFVLTERPVKQFTTQLDEIISVEIPIEMAFQTKNQDLGTIEAGEIYAKNEDYRVVNKGTVPLQVSVSNFQTHNEAANSITLVTDSNSLAEQDALHLKLLGLGKNKFSADLTEAIQEKAVLIGEVNTTDQKDFRLDFSGKFFNPFKPSLNPKYQLTLKFEQVK